MGIQIFWFLFKMTLFLFRNVLLHCKNIILIMNKDRICLRTEHLRAQETSTSNEIRKFCHNLQAIWDMC